MAFGSYGTFLSFAYTVKVIRYELYTYLQRQLFYYKELLHHLGNVYVSVIKAKTQNSTLIELSDSEVL